MNKFELNIGLVGSRNWSDKHRSLMLPANYKACDAAAYSDKIERLTTGIVSTFNGNGYNVQAYRVDYDAAVEPTLVLEVQPSNPEKVYTWLLWLSTWLSQDCIAIRYLDGTGELIGEHTPYWGAYDDSKFVRV